MTLFENIEDSLKKELFSKVNSGFSPDRIVRDKVIVICNIITDEIYEIHTGELLYKTYREIGIDSDYLCYDIFDVKLNKLVESKPDFFKKK